MLPTIELTVGKLNDRIPKLIHQTWKTETIPDKLRPLQKTVIDHNPEPQWTYKLWTDQDNYNFMEQNYPWFMQYYKGYHHNIQRVDACRYFIMYHYGGVYLDLDMQCLADFSPLIEQIGGVILGQEGQMHFDGTQQVGNAVIFSSPRHPFWLKVFQALVENFKFSDPEKISSVFKTTGPYFLHEVFLKNPQGVTVMPPNAFYPIPWEKPKDKIELVHKRLHPKSWTVHHWQGLWRNAPRQVHLVYQDNNRQLQMLLVIPRNKLEGCGVIEQSIRKGYLHRQRLVEEWGNLLSSGDNAIVCGAYNGYLTVPLAMMLNPGKVIAFEPYTPARELMMEALRVNNLSNVSVYDCMPTSQQMPMFLVNKFNPLKPHVTVWRGQQPNAVAVCMGCKIDALLIENVSLLHISVNGEEYQVLQGAEQIIQRDRPYITIDIISDQRRTELQTPIRQDQVFMYINRLGYTASSLEGTLYLLTPNEGKGPKHVQPQTTTTMYYHQPQQTVGDIEDVPSFDVPSFDQQSFEDSSVIYE